MSYLSLVYSNHSHCPKADDLWKRRPCELNSIALVDKENNVIIKWVPIERESIKSCRLLYSFVWHGPSSKNELNGTLKDVDPTRQGTLLQEQTRQELWNKNRRTQRNNHSTSSQMVMLWPWLKRISQFQKGESIKWELRIDILHPRF